jgi:hypothetical protein
MQQMQFNRVSMSRAAHMYGFGVPALGIPCQAQLLLSLLLLLQVRAMYDAYKSPAVSLDGKQLLAWNMIMVGPQARC